jgi:hypothetical protein
MIHRPTYALSNALDRLESAVDGDHIAISAVVERLGRNSFATLMLVFSLVSTSPASAIPGVTTMVGSIVFLLVAQMLAGRESVWLPDFIMQRQMSSANLCKGIRWLRKPVHFVERFLSTRLEFMFHRPWRWMSLVPILCLALLMPFMEIIPMSGSIASAIIAFYAAGLLMRDGVVVLLALGLLLGSAGAFWALWQ